MLTGATGIALAALVVIAITLGGGQFAIRTENHGMFHTMSPRQIHKLLKGLTYVPRVIITDKLKSYGAAKREILPGVEHRHPALSSAPPSVDRSRLSSGDAATIPELAGRSRVPPWPPKGNNQ